MFNSSSLVPSWTNITDSSFDGAVGAMDEPLGDFFDSSSFGFIDPSIRGSFDGVANKPVSKRKELSEPKEPSTKRIKAELGTDEPGVFNVIETSELDGPSSQLLNDEEILALSDALSEATDSFDEESAFDDESGDDSLSGAEDGPEDDDFDDAHASSDQLSAKKSKSGDKKARGNYACSKCGMAKRGHMCAFQPRIRRRAGGSGGSAAVAVVPSSGGASIPAGIPRLASSNKAAPRIKAAVAAAEPVQRCEMAAGPSALFVVAPKGPVMCSTGSQCELEPSNTVRELYLDSQGFPESYSQGILADPLFNLGTARTVTVSRPAPKSYKPRAKTSSSCGAGPDLMGAMSSSPFLSHPLLGQPLDPLGLMRGPGLAPSLTLNHLALLMSSYQHSLAHSLPHSLAHGSGEIDPALASLFFPVTSTMPQVMGRRE